MTRTNIKKTMFAAAAGATLLATTGLASAQELAVPYYGYGYYGAPIYGYVAPVPLAPGYYNYVPAPYYDNWNYNGWNGWNSDNGWYGWNEW